MRVTLNGDERDLPDGLTAGELLDTLGLRREVVVVERNQVVLARKDLDATAIEDGDTIEVIQMIAGG
jgi:sulfur carrier protein